MATTFVRIPPDSTGKRIRHYERVDIEVTNIVTPLSSISYASTITGASSGVTGTYTGFANLESGDTRIFVENATGTFTDGETIRVDGSDIADIIATNGTAVAYTPQIHISDPRSPDNVQRVDRQGSAYVRFVEGDMPFDAFGHAQFTSPNIVDTHKFIYGDTPNKYYTQEIGGGSVFVSVSSSMCVFSVDNISGSRAVRTSNLYYPYFPGEGTEVLMSVMSGDAGKAGVVRRWGLYDDEDGLFFELSGSVLHAVTRNSSTGQVVDTKIPASSFNGDSLQDANSSNFVIDYSKLNLYYIDFQWLGVGRARFGAFSPEGPRVIMHTVENPNANVFPYMRRGTLPFRMEIFNKNNSASTSELKLVCASIVRQSSNEDLETGNHSFTKTRIPVTGSFTPVASFRPRLTVDGEINRSVVIPFGMDYDVDGDPIEIKILLNPTLAGDTWTEATSSYRKSLMEIDTAASSSSGGTVTNTILLSGTDFRKFEEDFSDYLNIGADGVTQNFMTFSARTLRPSGSANLSFVIRWKELE